MSSQAPKRLAVVLCSTRKPRVGAPITSLVFSAISKHLKTTHKGPALEASILDLADHPLPFFDEPLAPQVIKDPANYAHNHTRAWSRVISSYQAFVFVTPQYNWNVPASLKNALDFLYHEWSEKPVLVVSYGGHGGGKAAAALLESCKAMHMTTLEETVQLPLVPRDRLEKAMKDGELQGDEETFWKDQLDRIPGLLDKLVDLLVPQQKEYDPLL